MDGETAVRKLKGTTSSDDIELGCPCRIQPFSWKRVETVRGTVFVVGEARQAKARALPLAGRERSWFPDCRQKIVPRTVSTRTEVDDLFARRGFARSAGARQGHGGITDMPRRKSSCRAATVVPPHSRVFACHRHRDFRGHSARRPSNSRYCRPVAYYAGRPASQKSPALVTSNSDSQRTERACQSFDPTAPLHHVGVECRVEG